MIKLQKVFLKIRQLKKVNLQLKDILAREKSDLVRDAAVQRFEYTVEIAWKTLQKYLAWQELVCPTPRECIKAAYKAEIIDNLEAWIDLLKLRNQTSHAYGEEIAEDVYSNIGNLQIEVEKLIQNLNQKLLKEKLLEIISKFSNLDDIALFVFGSQADQTANAKSDLDLGLLGREKLDPKILNAIKTEIEDLPFMIDLVDFNSVEDDFKNFALKHIIIWHQGKNISLIF